ncbi:hypothetical protein [Enterocloster bolteae]|uniref:phage neck terminator protein n=1 Tax=Enterocloster bolteae TaxID=208479 RepID=UPI002A83749D|nr:hypothetical protein [Enterocloster bolteae]
MSLSLIRGQIFNLVSEFFLGATVAWVEQVNTKPEVPYVTLKTGAVNKSLFPVSDEIPGTSFYICNTVLEINLYTKGREVRIEGHEDCLVNYENTAVSDLVDFVLFLESEEIVDRIAGYNLDIQLMSPVRDLTELLNDSKYRYRSMAEFTVNFMLESSGRFGVSGMEQIPNSSGGGSEGLADTTTETIENIIIEKEWE